MFKHFLLFLCSFAFLPLAKAQIEDLTQDTAFFEDQTEVYQRWLDHSGLGQYLSVYDIEVEKDMLSVYLNFPYSDLDSIQNAWDQLKSDFEDNSAITLEEQLLYKASFIMEVDQHMINVQIYDTYKLLEKETFMRAIFFQDGQVYTEEDNPRDKRESFTLRPTDLSNNKEENSTDFQQRFSKQQVYERIYSYAQKRFKQAVCLNRNPDIRLLEQDNNLVFEVTDLCREVLTDEANPVLCQLWNTFSKDQCNWVKRELLRFTFTYEELSDGGFRLVVVVDGKVGSGFYDEVKRGGYMSMEVDFDEYLETYAQSFTTELRRVLLNRN
jgi:hypothetical protein